MFGSIFVRVGRLEEARAVLQLAVQSGHAEIAPIAAAELAALDERDGTSVRETESQEPDSRT
jgi:hypothetical protein